MSPEDVDALAACARTFLATGYDCWDSDRVRRAARDMAQAVVDATPKIRRLLKEVVDLQEAIRRQAAAVRMSETARTQIDAHERKTLTSLAGQERAALLEELAAAREEASRWNATATQVEEERDALRADNERLRSILGGCTVPPTDAQIREHLRDKPDDSTGLHRGSWLITSEYGRLPLVRRDVATCIAIAEEQRARQPSWCWIALDRNGRPCARPETP